ncbi:MAG: DUF2786 domain-containing protein [Pseudomonadota bacterium]|nr:DUF2786 domain-containing protein [Pseudomonadota bacterium]
MPPSSPDILARVRKLLALAGSPNVHEAAAAAAAAQALVVRHRLEALLAAESLADDPDDPITDGREAPLESARRIRKWKVALAMGLAEANGCVAYTAPVGDETQLLLVGRASDRAAVIELWAWLVTRIEWLSATHGPGKPRDWHEAFRIGAAEAIATRLAAVEAAVEAEVTADPARSPAALVRLEPARAARATAVDAFVDRHLRLGKGRTLRVDGRALERGRQAGAEVVLPTPRTRR